jgi:hypothetical protein
VDLSTVKLSTLPLDARYQRILQSCVPFVISYPANYPSLDLAPYGVTIDEAHRFTATSLKSRDVVDGLHHLDAVTFGDQDMLMPRWVLFDCGEFPGIVFGFGRRSADLPDHARAHYRVLERDDAFVPLSMWVAIPCAEPRAWFGHNLSSANLLLQNEDALPGLATLTKVLGVKLTRAAKQYGATQWSSHSIGLHLRLGPMELLSAYTPAHTHEETFAYLIHTDDARLTSSLREGWTAPESEGARTLDADDHDGIRALHDEIEAGARWRLIRAERRDGNPQRMHLEPVDD